MRISPGLVCVVSLINFSCATIIKGSRQTIPIIYHQDSVLVEVNQNTYTHQPEQIQLKRFGRLLPDGAHFGHVVEFSRPDSARQQVILQRKFNYWLLGNILFGPGIAVDLLTGATFTLKPKRIDVNLGLKQK